MNLKTQKSTITVKKQQFRREVRSQYLQNYMRKIRTQMHDSQEYLYLINLINSIYSPSNLQNQVERQRFLFQKVSQIIALANQGRSVAVVALADLLLNNIITIETIQILSLEEDENSQNQNNNSSVNDLMRIIKFPPQNQRNEGWLALIRILVKLNYCTQEMIIYCMRTIAKNKSLQSVQFALQVIYTLLIEKKMINIEELSQMMSAIEKADSNSCSSKLVIQQNLLIENFFDSLMKFSLPSTILEASHDVRYFATKIISRSFSSEKVCLDILIKYIPLQKITNFLDQKFAAKSIWQRSKALQMANDLLEGLKDFTLYQAKPILAKMFVLTGKIMHEVSVVSLQIYQKNSGQLGHSQAFSSISQLKPEKDLLKFIQEAVYFTQILVESYLFTHNSLHMTNQFLEKFTFQISLDAIYQGFAQELGAIKHNHYRIEEREGLTSEQQAKLWVVQKVSRIAVSLQEKLISVSQSLKQGSQDVDQEEVDKFFTLSILVQSRLKESHIIADFYQQMGQKQCEI